MATIRFEDQTQKASYEYEVEGPVARALHQIYMHLSLYPADAVDLEWRVVADEDSQTPESIDSIRLPHSSVHNFGVRTSAEEREVGFQLPYSGMMHSIRDEKVLVLRVLSQIS